MFCSAENGARKTVAVTFAVKGGSPGLVVTAGDSCPECRGLESQHRILDGHFLGEDSYSKGFEFESWHHILDGHFFTFNCCKNCNICLKRRK